MTDNGQRMITLRFFTRRYNIHKMSSLQQRHCAAHPPLLPRKHSVLIRILDTETSRYVAYLMARGHLATGNMMEHLRPLVERRVNTPVSTAVHEVCTVSTPQSQNEVDLLLILGLSSIDH